MRRLIIISLSFLLSIAVYGQIELLHPDSIKEYKTLTVPVYSKSYMNKYNRSKRLVLKVYPYALFAADLVDEIENNSAAIQKRRKQKKFYRRAYDDLKENFKYVILDMYTSEGRMLVKLVHRETGMTVFDIASKYRGKSKAKVFSLMGKLFDQDIKSTFKPNGEDKITEHVIQDIDAGIIKFDDTADMLKKDDYKRGKAEYKAQLKRGKQKRKEREKQARERQKRKQSADKARKKASEN